MSMTLLLWTWGAGIGLLLLALLCIRAREGAAWRWVDRKFEGDGAIGASLIWPLVVGYGVAYYICLGAWGVLRFVLYRQPAVVDTTLMGEEFTPALDAVDAALKELDSITTRRLEA